jgi:3-oxoacyl-[acyl-carrier-protein] synthase-3
VAVTDRERPRGEPIAAVRPAAETARALWLAGAAVRLPRQVQPAPQLDEAVGRPVGWLERRAGIRQRHVWGDEDPLDAAAKCAAQALLDAGVPTQATGALIAVSEATPLAIGLGAALHHRLGLNVGTPCFEVGCACVGFLSAMALARSLVPQLGPVLVVSVEAHSRVLPLVPGPRGEAAALFGDGCAAAVFAGEPAGETPARLVDLELFADGSSGDRIRVRPSGDDTGFSLEMDGVPLTEFALHALASATRALTAKHGLSVADLAAVVAHGGNGRMPAMLARLLHLPSARVWSDVTMTGNLGSASVPAAWASRVTKPRGPVIWTAVGAGLLWGAALWQVDARV